MWLFKTDCRKLQLQSQSEIRMGTLNSNTKRHLQLGKIFGECPLDSTSEDEGHKYLLWGIFFGKNYASRSKVSALQWTEVIIIHCFLKGRTEFMYSDYNIFLLSVTHWFLGNGGFEYTSKFIQLWAELQKSKPTLGGCVPCHINTLAR